MLLQCPRQNFAFVEVNRDVYRVSMQYKDAFLGEFAFFFHRSFLFFLYVVVLCV